MLRPLREGLNILRTDGASAVDDLVMGKRLASWLHSGLMQYFSILLRAVVLTSSGLLLACATPSPVVAQAAPSLHPIMPPAQWQAPLPHGGSAVALTHWWAQWGDPLLIELIDAAQQRSPSLAAARSRIAQSRSALTLAQASVRPNVNASAQASRGAATPGVPLASSLSVGVQAAWELDVFGGNAAGRDASALRLENAQLGWHEARVSLAADTALAYFSLRYCNNVLVLTQGDSTSRQETARLNELTAKAGLNAPANAALARASALDAASSVRASQAQCSALRKALVALSGLEESVLYQKLQAKQAEIHVEYAPTAAFSIAPLPARVLQQRPDIAAAQRSVAAAALDTRSADARRWPSLGLSGSIGGASVVAGGATNTGLTWSLGPLALSLPLLDNGVRAANSVAANAVYDEAVVSLRAKVLQAVREVEEALVNLDSVATRRADVQAAAAGYRAALEATQARYAAGLASLSELEDARRIALVAQHNQLGLERERIAASIALYRAVGGGWGGEVDAIAP